MLLCWWYCNRLVYVLYLICLLVELVHVRHMYTIWKMPKWIKNLTIQKTTQVIFGVFPPNCFLYRCLFHGYLCGVSITEAILCEWFSPGIIISYSIKILQKCAFEKWHSLFHFCWTFRLFPGFSFFLLQTMFRWPFLYINISLNLWQFS